MNNSVVSPRHALSMLFVCLVLAPCALAAQEPEAGPFRFQYAAKVLCTSNIPGTSQTTDSLLPGSYQTVVNIHNPNAETIRLRKKIATTLGISKFVGGGLKPDEAGKVDCREIAQGFGITFIHGVEGFLVIESTHSLDVIAVYTAGKGDVASIDVEQVRERPLK